MHEVNFILGHPVGTGMSSSIGMVPIRIPGILFLKISGIGIGTTPIPVSVSASLWMSEHCRYQYWYRDILGN